MGETHGILILTVHNHSVVEFKTIRTDLLEVL